MTTTANETIIPALATAFRTSFAFKGGQFTAPGSEGTIVVRRAHGTTAEVTILNAASRCAEIKMLVEIAEALTAAGFAPVRHPYDVTVCWDVVSAARRVA
ncbi:hypothetical protein [Sorangium sp. So ce131]|uniref:hypothetical protein n=1 Tax=Sorangium sp. So ce131 TaxID=3133282 RepID=UPI003F5DCE67